MPLASPPRILGTALRKQKARLLDRRDMQNSFLDVQPWKSHFNSPLVDIDSKEVVNIAELSQVLQHGAIREYVQRNKVQPPLAKHPELPKINNSHRKVNSLINSVKMGDYSINQYHISYRLFPVRSPCSPKLRSGNTNTFHEFNKSRFLNI